MITTFTQSNVKFINSLGSATAAQSFIIGLDRTTGQPNVYPSLQAEYYAAYLASAAPATPPPVPAPSTLGQDVSGASGAIGTGTQIMNLTKGTPAINPTIC